MSNTIILTDEQMKALQAGQSITIDPPKKVTKWEPKGGHFHISETLGSIEEFQYKNSTLTEAGLTYQTHTQAEKASKALRSYARQLAWLAENDDGWVADWNIDNQFNYYIYYNEAFGKYEKAYNHKWKMLNTIYMSVQNAEKLCNLLNDGIVEF